MLMLSIGIPYVVPYDTESILFTFHVEPYVSANRCGPMKIREFNIFNTLVTCNVNCSIQKGKKPIRLWPCKLVSLDINVHNTNNRIQHLNDTE